MSDLTDPVVDALKNLALQEVARIYAEPRLAEAAFAAAAATEQLSREERVVVLLMTVMSTIEHCPLEFLLDTVATLSLAQHAVIGAQVWVEYARKHGVRITQDDQAAPVV